MSADTHARQPAGTPVGGQFAATARPETGVQLDGLADGRLADIRFAGDLVNQAYDSLADSDVLETLRADNADGTESDYPHAEHGDAMRALRRYRDALAGRASGDGGTVPGVLAEPLTRWEAVDAANEDGWLSVTVRADLGELVQAGYHNDDFTVDDALAAKAVNGVLPYDSSYAVVGVDDEGSLLVEFTTNVGAELDHRYGEGMFAACKDGQEAAVCVDCDEPYELAEGHDCEEGLKASGTCSACNVLDHETCPGVPGCSCCEDTAAGVAGDGGCPHRAYARTCPECN